MLNELPNMAQRLCTLERLQSPAAVFWKPPIGISNSEASKIAQPFELIGFAGT